MEIEVGKTYISQNGLNFIIVDECEHSGFFVGGRESRFYLFHSNGKNHTDMSLNLIEEYVEPKKYYKTGDRFFIEASEFFSFSGESGDFVIADLNDDLFSLISMQTWISLYEPIKVKNPDAIEIEELLDTRVYTFTKLD